jgi:hypothetical protein
MTKNALVVLSRRSDQGKGVDERMEWKASWHSRWYRRGERRKAVRQERGKRTVLLERQLELCFRCNLLFVCYFVFDWWGVSSAIKIRLDAGLLSLLPLDVGDVIACAHVCY